MNEPLYRVAARGQLNLSDLQQCQDPEIAFQTGLVLLRERRRPGEALVAFERSVQLRPNEARFNSYLGLTVAMTEGRLSEAERLCADAATREFYRADLFFNLGRVCLMRGDRRGAQIAFRRGLAAEHDNPEIIKALHTMGIRRRPVFAFLPRASFPNRMAGKVLYRVGVRRPLVLDPAEAA
jgi:Flp pilus assembly protein TadD